MFTLSCGFLPFGALSQADVIAQMTAPEQVIHTRLQMSPQFQSLNILLQDLILKMLRVNPLDRLTSQQVLKHPWFVMKRNESLKEERKMVEVRDLKAMAIYGKTPVLKKITQMYLAVRLTQQSCSELKQKFDLADRDGNGTISPAELNRIFVEATGN